MVMQAKSVLRIKEQVHSSHKSLKLADYLSLKCNRWNYRCFNTNSSEEMDKMEEMLTVHHSVETERQRT